MKSIAAETIFTINLSASEVHMIIDSLDESYDNKAERLDGDNYIFKNTEEIERILKLRNEFIGLI